MNQTQLFVLTLSIIGITCAIIAFIRTPSNQKFGVKAQREKGVDYAPQYSTRERITIVIKHATWFIPLYAFLEIWFFPWLDTYSINAGCYTYGNFTGTHVVLYSTMVGLPLIFSILSLPFLVRGIRIIRLDQNPLPGEKVFGLTRYSYGLKARVQSFIFVVVTPAMLAIGIWGYYSANSVISEGKVNVSQCDAN